MSATRATRTSGRSISWVSLAGLVVAFGLAGCAAGSGPATVIHQGQIGPGRYLATVVVQEQGCWPHGTACAVQDAEQGIMFLPSDTTTPPVVYEQFARELCHVVAFLRGVPAASEVCAKAAGSDRLARH
jgi:hypothetical protein